MGLFSWAAKAVARSVGLTDPRLGQWLSDGPTYAGKNVTPDTALQLDAVWACVRLIAQTIATLPLNVMQRDAAGHWSVAPTHPLQGILHDQPNADMTAVEFWEAMVGCFLLWGNAFAEIVRNGSGQVVALLPMRPDRVAIRRQEDGSLLYTYSFQGRVLHLQEDAVLHLKGFSLDGMTGLSPVACARQSLGTALAAEEVSARFFGNGLRLWSYISAPNFLQPKQRAEAKEIIERFKGAQNAGGTPLLEGGWKVETLGMPPQDAQLLEVRSWHVDVICRWFDTPPPLVGHMDNATAYGATLEQLQLRFVIFTLRPHLVRIEQAIRRKLIPPTQRASTKAEFNVEGLLRGDSAARAALYAVQAQNGLKSRNEIRARENDPPMDGADGLTVQSNLVPLDQLGKVTPDQTPEGFGHPPKPQSPTTAQEPVRQ